MSEHATPDPSQQWVELLDPAATTDDAGAEQAEGVAVVQDLGNKYSTVSMVVRQQEADAAKIDEAFALKFVSQAVHVLSEAVSLAVASKQWVSKLSERADVCQLAIVDLQELGMQATLRLVDCVGLLDPPLSSLYLAFYQVSCTVRPAQLAHHTHQTESDRLCPDEGLPLQAAE